MKIAVVGFGSIGRRHAKNLTNMGHEVVPIDLKNPLTFDVDCAFICSPTQYHAEHAIEYISRDVPVFIEKPITHSLEDLEKLEKAIEAKPVISMVGCNLRFHPSLREAKSMVDRKRVIYARAEFGYYLPFWRKGDYTKSYSASKYGGIIIDDIHEVDYLFWLFGDFKDFKIVCDKVSDLEIEKEDIAEISMVFERGVSASVHCDYLMKNYHRELTLYFPHQSVKYDLFPTNLMYKKEIEYFLGCVRDGVEPMNNIKEAAYVLRKIINAKECGCHNSGKANLD